MNILSVSIFCLGFGIVIGCLSGIVISKLSIGYLIGLIVIISSSLFYFRRSIKSYFTTLFVKAIFKIAVEDPKEEKVSNFSLNKEKTVATISYQHNNKEYKVYLPYDSINARIKSKRVYATFSKQVQIDSLTDDNYDIIEEIKELNNDIDLNITQQPGLPYFITCADLGADRIEVRMVDNEVIKQYRGFDKIIL